MLYLFFRRLRGPQARGAEKGTGRGVVQFRCNSLKRLVSEKEMKASERSFAFSRACFQCAGASKGGIGAWTASAERKRGAYTVSLAEIALAEGFSDQSHMTREAKAFSGLTPAQFRPSIPRG